MFNLWYYLRRRSRYDFKPVILVTGCSSGIGLAIAELLAKRHQYRVVVTARQSSLIPLKKRFKETERFLIRALDITSSEERKNLVQEIQQRWGAVNILVNNAGVSYRAALEHMSEQDELHQMDVNYLGPTALTRLVLPKMRETGRGKIINISSVSGMLAMPTMASYSASKYALEGMSEALWYEMKPFGINVSLIQPGFVRSRSYEKVYYTELSRKAESAGENEVYGDYYANMKPFISRLMRLSLTRPKSIAKLVVKVIQTENPPLWIPATLDAVLFYYMRRIVPRRVLMQILFFSLPKVRRWGQRHTKRRPH